MIVSPRVGDGNVGVIPCINNSALLCSALALESLTLVPYQSYFFSYLTIILVSRGVHFHTLPRLGIVDVCYHNGYLIKTLIGLEAGLCDIKMRPS